MGLLTIVIAGPIGAVSLPLAGVVLGITAVGPVAGGLYATWMSAGVVIPVVQSTLMTVGVASVAKTTVVGVVAGLLI